MKKQIYLTGICTGCRIENYCRKKFEFGNTCSSKPAAVPGRKIPPPFKSDTSIYKMLVDEEDIRRAILE